MICRCGTSFLLRSRSDLLEIHQAVSLVGPGVVDRVLRDVQARVPWRCAGMLCRDVTKSFSSLDQTSSLATELGLREEALAHVIRSDRERR